MLINCVSGCAEMINRALWRKMGDYSEAIEMHDWWTVWYATSCGVMSYIPEALILYRHHTENFTTSAYNENETNPVRRILRIVRKPFHVFGLSRKRFYRRGRMYKLFLDRYAQDMTANNLELLKGYADMFGTSRLKRLSALARTHYLSRHDFLEDLLFIFKLIVY